jgi:excisionase family DNA binding protein
MRAIVISSAKKSSSPSTPLAVAPREACRLLSVSPATLYGLLSTGELENFHIGRARRISTRSIQDFILRQIATRKPHRQPEANHNAA